MWLTRSMSGSAQGGLVWDRPGAVVEVPDDLALELLAIPKGGFAEVAAPEPAQEPDEASAAEDAEAAPKRATRARKTPVAE